MVFLPLIAPRGKKGQKGALCENSQNLPLPAPLPFRGGAVGALGIV